MEIIDKYAKELEDDSQLDRMNVSEKQLKLPAIRAKWITRFINTKQDLNELYGILDEAIDKVSEKIKKESQIAISTPTAEKQAESNDLVKKIRKQIKENQLIIEFLEKVEKSTHVMTYDIKNVVDIIKSEQN